MDKDLPLNAQAAWSAYVAMGVSKQRHFEFLQHLADKYRDLNRPTAQESSQLQNLLREHDAQVKIFTAAVQQLKAADPDAYGVLIQHMVAANTEPGDKAPPPS
jgi:hypothetical protein